LTRQSEATRTYVNRPGSKLVRTKQKQWRLQDYSFQQI